MTYGRTHPPVLVLNRAGTTILSAQGRQKGDRASVLLFSVTTHSLIRKNGILLDQWYGDDGALTRTLDALSRALRLLVRDRPSATHAPGMCIRLSIDACLPARGPPPRHSRHGYL